MVEQNENNAYPIHKHQVTANRNRHLLLGKFTGLTLMVKYL